MDPGKRPSSTPVVHPRRKVHYPEERLIVSGANRRNGQDRDAKIRQKTISKLEETVDYKRKMTLQNHRGQNQPQFLMNFRFSFES